MIPRCSFCAHYFLTIIIHEDNTIDHDWQWCTVMNHPKKASFNNHQPPSNHDWSPNSHHEASPLLTQTKSLPDPDIRRHHSHHYQLLIIMRKRLHHERLQRWPRCAGPHRAQHPAQVGGAREVGGQTTAGTSCCCWDVASDLKQRRRTETRRDRSGDTIKIENDRYMLCYLSLCYAMLCYEGTYDSHVY